MSKSSRKPPLKPPTAVSPARFEAFSILMEVERSASAHADDLLRGAGVSRLSAPDRNLCTALVLGVLRWQIRLDASIRGLLTKPNARLDPPIAIALRMGLFQLQFLSRIPAHAAIGESVSLARLARHQHASRMVNAVLRMLSQGPKPDCSQLPEEPTELAQTTAHPAWLVQRWAARYGMAAAQAICRHGQRQPELDLRIESPAVEAELTAQGVDLAEGAFLTAARRILRGDVTVTQAFLDGHLRIQEEGSQWIAELGADPTQFPRRILDCCAAPGGKTLILAERNPQATVLALDASPARCQALRLRIAASPLASQIEVRLGDATELSAQSAVQIPVEHPFDLILADVPCSGTGTLGRNPEIRHRLQPSDLPRHHARQCAILHGALQVGTGRVIYSTCSLEPEENEEVVAEVLAANPAWRQLPIAQVLRSLRRDEILTPEGEAMLLAAQDPNGAITLVPGNLGADLQTDGFFVAILEKSN